MDGLVELGAAALPEVDELREAISWGAGSWFLGPLIETGGCILGRRDESGRLVAMGATAVFGTMGFICNMVVRPGLKRQGLGRAVFEGLLGWLRERGISQVQLEATEEGKPLYEQYGFRVRWESVSASLPSVVAPGGETGIAPIAPGDWAGVAILDRAAYGGDRIGFLRTLTGGPHEAQGMVLREGGTVTGFGFRWSQRIGPVVAADAVAGERLVRALASRSQPGVFATIGHPQHAPMWERLGFDVAPFDVRMTLGPEPVDEPGMVISMLNGGVG